MDEATDMDFLLLQLRAQVDQFGDMTVEQFVNVIRHQRVKDLLQSLIDGIANS